MENNEFVVIKRRDLIEVLRHLNTIVISIDRIGSCIEETGQDANDRLLLDFFDRWDIWKKLSEVRSKLSEPFSYELGEDGMDELEREMQDVTYWSLANKLPPNE